MSKFGSDLLAASASDSQTLSETFPHAKFIFPNAPRRRTVIYKRSLTHQWFDCWHLSEPSKREDLQSTACARRARISMRCCARRLSWWGHGMWCFGD